MGKSLGAMNIILAASIDIGRKSITKPEPPREQESIITGNGVSDGTHLTNGYSAAAIG